MKLDPNDVLLCSKCEEPFEPGEDFTQIVTGTAGPKLITFDNVDGVPAIRNLKDTVDAFNGSDFYHADCAKEARAELAGIKVDSLKELVTNALTAKQQKDLYKYMHDALGVRL